MSSAQKLLVTAQDHLEFVDITLPEPTRRQALIKGLFSGISHATELAVLNQTTPTFSKHWDSTARCFVDGQPSKKYPASLGYEYVGQVTAVGEAVHELHVGDFVWADAAHQTQVLIDVDHTPFFRLEGKRVLKKAAFLALTRVALAAVHDAHPKIGDVYFVSGLGTIGLIVIQLLKRAGVTQIYASDPIRLRRDHARRLGATVFNPLTEDVGSSVKQRWPSGVDAAIECSGSSHALHDAVKTCGMGGKVITVATYRNAANEFFMGEEWHRNRITMISSMSVNGAPHRDHPLWDLTRLNHTALDLLQSSAIEVESLITHTLPFRQARRAYELIQNTPEETLKVVLEYT